MNAPLPFRPDAAATAPLRCAVLCPAGTLPRWQTACIEALAEAGEAICVAVLLPPAPATPGPRPGVLDRLYAAAIRRGTRALDHVDPAPGVPRFAPDSWAKAGSLDAVLAFDAAEVPGLPAARFGTWRFRIGGRPPTDAGLPGQAEIAARHDAVRIELVAESGDGVRLLHRTVLPMRRTHARLLDALAEAAPALCLGACRRLARDALAIASRPGDVAAPARGALAAVAGQVAGLARRLGGLVRRDEWRIGVVQTTPEALLAGPLLPPPCWLAAPRRGTFHADPFPLAAGGQAALLFEMYDEAEGRGWIAATPLDAPRAITQAATAIDLGCHMSYPSVFRFAGATYCAPEAAAGGRLRLFRMGATPWDWTEVAHVPPEGRLADPTLFEHAGRWWMFATPDGPAVGTDLHLWHAATPFGPWTAHPLNPVVSDVGAARPAGAVFVARGDLIRPGQDCAGSYGRAVVLHRILRLDATGYEEEAVVRIEPGRAWPARDGLHTLNWLDGRLVLDAKRRLWDPFGPWRRLGRQPGARLARRPRQEAAAPVR